MPDYKLEDYLAVDIFPTQDDKGNMSFSKGNVDSLLEKYLKMKKQFEEYKKRSEAIDNENYYQFSMAKASEDYYRQECDHLRERLRTLQSMNREYDKFMPMNVGLRKECQKYKQKILNYEQKIYILQKESLDLFDDFIRENYLSDDNITIGKLLKLISEFLNKSDDR